MTLSSQDNFIEIENRKFRLNLDDFRFVTECVISRKGNKQLKEGTIHLLRVWRFFKGQLMVLTNSRSRTILLIKTNENDVNQNRKIFRSRRKVRNCRLCPHFNFDIIPTQYSHWINIISNDVDEKRFTNLKET